MIKNLILTIGASLCIVFNSFGQKVVQEEFIGAIVPQYMNLGTSTRLATPFYATILGLTPSSDYKYYVTFVLSSDFGTTTTGAGSTLFMDDADWSHIASPSMSSGKHDTINAGGGTIEGWFAGINTGNSRFTAGNYVFPLIVLEEIGGTDKKRLALTDSIKVLDYATTADTLSGTGIYGNTKGKGKKFVALYDDENGIRPISISHLEDDKVTIASSVAYWSSNVEGREGAWGTIIPNDLDSGIRKIELLDYDFGNVLFTNYSSNGKWGNSNTVNPSGSSTSPIYIDSLYAPLAKPMVKFTSGTGMINEKDSNYYVVIEKRFVSRDVSKIKINVLGGSATNNTDYEWINTQVLTLKTGVFTKDTFLLKIKEDNFSEYSETILLEITEVENVAIDGNGKLIINIEDNDTTIFNFKSNIVTAVENQGTVKIPITKINGHANKSQNVVVELKSQGSFTFSNEFTFGTGNKETVNFLAGKEIDSGFVVVNIVNESKEDFDDTLIFVLKPKAGEVIGPDSIVTVVIKNDDITPLFTFEKAQIDIIEADTNLVFRVIRTKKNSNSSDIKVTMVQLLSTASNSYDFVFNPTARIIDVPASSSDTIEFVVSIKDDEFFENTEQIYFKLEDLNNAAVGPFNNLRIRIIEDDHKKYKINEINQLDADGELVSTDLDIAITGIVYGVNMRPLGTPEGFQFTIRDNTGGLQVFSPSGSFGYTVKEGDSITVKGVLGQFAGVSQITFVEEIDVHDSNASLKTPVIIQGLSESTESDLIKFENVILVDEAEWPLIPLTTNQHKDVRVKNKTGTFILRIDSDTDIDGTIAPVGYFNIIGLGGQDDYVKPLDSVYQIYPRYKEDIIARTQKVLTMEGDSIRVFERYTDSTDLITVRVSNITQPTLIEVGVESSTATEILDYKFDTPHLIVFAPGDTVSTFKVKIVDNGTDQTDKVIVLGFKNIPYGIITGEGSTYLIRIIDDETTGISDLEKELKLSLYPNPTKGILNISSIQKLEKATLFNIQGKQLLETSLNELDLSTLPKGMYLLTLQFGKDKIVTKRIVVE
jgi:hypothetical protein